MTERRPSMRFLLIWHALVAALLLAILELRLGGPAQWSLRPREFLASELLLGAYGITALVSIVAAAIGRPLRLITVVAASLAIFGMAFFALLMLAPTPPYSRALLLIVVGVAFALAVASVVAERFRWLSLALLAAGAAGVIGLDLYKAFGPRKQPPMTHTIKELATALYPVAVESYENPVPRSVVYGGALAVVGDRYLLATGDGHLYVFSWPAGGKLTKPQLLPNLVPYNAAEFIDASHTHWSEADANTARADTIKGVQTWQFRVADVLVKSEANHLRVFVSHHYWNRKDQCFTARVSVLDADREAFLAGKASDHWETLYEATPCMPIEGPNSLRASNPFSGMEVGGRMAFVDDDTLLLSLGDHGFSGIGTDKMFSQDPQSSYGKTLLIHLRQRNSEVLTSGHRNPQGLFLDEQGVIWETEHGPQGGDELNILRKGANYGWPMVTYGTDYGSAIWPLSGRQAHHDGFVTPVYAWVPSIGVSNLLRLQQNAFPFWKDDLLIGSLHERAVYRVHLEEQRPVFAEAIPLGERVRDIIEGPDGQILMWTDNYNLISLHPARGASGALLFATRCGNCHRIGTGVDHSYGPDLHAIVGRKAGSNESFEDYSPAMKSFARKWTKDQLDRFLENPQAVVPGTQMSFSGVKEDSERAAIVDYLARQ